METIRFAEDYPKLQDDYFSTLRLHSLDIIPGSKVLIKSPSWEFEAILVSRNDVNLNEVLKSLIAYYPNLLDEKRTLQALWFVRDKRGD